ncbi:hypothetical protein [Pantoea sp. FN0307]|uniref:hypothetical protein n=1 Tax=Pantoea sp. FN0307 TaxID=3418560 RepID=UPI003CFB102E
MTIAAEGISAWIPAIAALAGIQARWEVSGFHTTSRLNVKEKQQAKNFRGSSILLPPNWFFSLSGLVKNAYRPPRTTVMLRMDLAWQCSRRVYPGSNFPASKATGAHFRLI